MRVLYYHQHFSTPEGSTGTRSYEMAKCLVRRGHHVTMVCGSYAGARTGVSGPFKRGLRSGVVEGIEVREYELPYSNSDGFVRRSWTFMRYALRSVLMALTARYDVVFATSTPLTAGIPGIVAALFRRKPFVFEVRDLWPELPKAMGVIRNPLVLVAMSALEWLSYRSATVCIGLAPGIVDGIASRGVPRERIVLVPNGSDLGLFGELGDKPWRPAEVASSDLLAVFAGTHGIANGLNAVLDAAAVLMRRSRHDIKIAFVGEGRLKNDLIARARTEGLSNCIFLPAIPKKRLAGLLAAADIGLMVLANVPAFYFGTSPNKFFDYLAAGLPVINNYPGWVADLISKHGCGVVVPPDDPDAFADALISLADNRTRLPAMRVASRRLAETEFHREKLSALWVSTIEKAVSR